MTAREFLHKQDVAYMNRLSTNLDFNAIVALMELYHESNINENTSDGYHTFHELYEIRKAYNVALFNELSLLDKYEVHKSKLHNDGNPPFGNKNWFIVCANLPNGQISNHYTIDNWDLFKIPEYTRALCPFDGHDTLDVVDRLLKLHQ